MEEISMEEEEEEGPNTTIIVPSPTWKLYDNPFFNYNPQTHQHRHGHHPPRHPNSTPTEEEHTLHQRSTMESTRLRLSELKAELELERRLRKKAESVNKSLLRDLWDERRRRESSELALGTLAAEMDKLRCEVAEERKMMRVAEVLREERVQMKLSEARLVMEEKLLRFSTNQEKTQMEKTTAEEDGGRKEHEENRSSVDMNRHNNFVVNSDSNGNGKKQQRKEVENPHIRRGIIGYVEFPTRLVRTRASGLMDSCLGVSREGKGDVGPKLECQKAQLRVLLKHNNRVTPLGALGSSGGENCVM